MEKIQLLLFFMLSMVFLLLDRSSVFQMLVIGLLFLILFEMKNKDKNKKI